MKWFLILLLCFYFYTIHQRNKEWKDAITLYSRIQLYNPTYRVLNNLAISYAEKGFKKQAEDTYFRAIQTNPQSPIAYFNLGNLYVASKYNQLAIKCYKKALEVNPNFFWAQIALQKINE